MTIMICMKIKTGWYWRIGKSMKNDGNYTYVSDWFVGHTIVMVNVSYECYLMCISYGFWALLHFTTNFRDIKVQDMLEYHECFSIKPNSITLLNWTHVFYWCKVSCGSKNGFQRDICLVAQDDMYIFWHTWIILRLMWLTLRWTWLI